MEMWTVKDLFVFALEKNQHSKHFHAGVNVLFFFFHRRDFHAMKEAVVAANDQRPLSHKRVQLIRHESDLSDMKAALFSFFFRFEPNEENILI